VRLSAGAAIVVVVVVVAAVGMSAASVSARSLTLPKRCPAYSTVGKALRLALRKNIVSYTSTTYQGAGPGSSRAMPSGPKPIHATQKTCLYTYSNAQQAAASGIVVPVTITYEFPVTKTNFSAARRAAERSIDTVTVRGLGDVAWVVPAPRGDPRGGISLFVLSGTTEVVVSAPPKATVGLMGSLVHRII
jgi:hypothetical protein